MWNLFGRRDKREAAKPPADDKPDSLDSMLQALDQGEAERELPTLICRACGLQYANTGTYLQGSRCPACHPQG